jgi:hypothetical protein
LALCGLANREHGEHAMTNSTAPDPPSSPLEAWLKLEACKQALDRLDRRVSRLRTSQLAVPSACAYIALATLGYAREQSALGQQAAAAAVAFDAATKATNDAQSAVLEAFDRYDAAEKAAADADARVALAPWTPDRSKLPTEQARTAQAAAEKTALDAAVRYRADRSDAQKKLADAEQALAQAQTALAAARQKREDFRAADRQRRYPGDLRQTPMPPELDRAVDEATAAVAQRRSAIDDAKNRIVNVSRAPAQPAPSAPPASSAPSASPASPGTAPSDSTDKAYQAQETVVLAAAAAKADVARAQADWSQKQRELEGARASAAAAEKTVQDLENREKGEGPTTPISLPVIGIALEPALFFATAPILLLVLLIDGRFAAAAVRRAAESVLGSARASAVRGEDVAPLVSGLEVDRLRRLFEVVTAVLVIAVLGLVYVASNARWLSAAAIPATVVVVGVDLWLRARRR